MPKGVYKPTTIRIIGLGEAVRIEDALSLAAIQEHSYARAGPGLLESYPRALAMDADGLAIFLGNKRYGVLATSRPDCRAHAAVVSFTVWRAAFWIATVEGAKVRNLRVRPYACIVVADGEPRQEHRAVITEGPARLHEGLQKDAIQIELKDPWREKHGNGIEWAYALIELHPKRIFSFDGKKEQ